MWKIVFPEVIPKINKKVKKKKKSVFAWKCSLNLCNSRNTVLKAALSLKVGLY